MQEKFEKINPENETAKWYVLHTNTGYENVAKENLRRVAEKNNLQDRIFDIIIPTEEVVEEKNGKKVLVEKKLTPTYIFVKMIYGDDIWHRVTGTRGITGFAGPKGRPLPLPEEDIINMRLEKGKAETSAEVGDSVEILDGPFNGQVGVVHNVDINNQKVTVMLEMFGRDTPIEVSFSEIRKLNQF